MSENRASLFCKENYKKRTTPRYVKLQMCEFIRFCEDKDKKYIINEKKLKQLENILKLLIMTKGLKTGSPLYDCTCDYQCFLLRFFARFIEKSRKKTVGNRHPGNRTKKLQNFHNCNNFYLAFFAGTEIFKVLFSRARRGFVA